MYDVISAQLYEKNFSKTKTINSFFFLFRAVFKLLETERAAFPRSRIFGS